MYVDVCNAPSQFLLAPNGTDGFYRLIATRFKTGENPCKLFSDANIVERKDCKEFYIYQVQVDLKAVEVRDINV